jgi:hypothetical protein
MPGTPKKNTSAFSLFELLLVLVVIAILLGLSAGALPRPNPVHGAQLVEAIVERARIEAIASGSPSAVVILVDEQSGDRLQKIGIVQQSVTDEAVWEFTSNPTFLPAGISLKEEACTSDETGTEAKRIRIPVRGGVEGEGDEWLFYGFTSGGEPLQPGGRIVVGDPQGVDDFRVELTNSGRPTPPFSDSIQ